MQYRRASTMQRVDEICLAVVIPQRTRVFPLGHIDHLRQLPRAAGVIGYGHEKPLLGCAEMDIKPAVVKPYRRCPRAFAVGRTPVASERKRGIDVRDYLPVDKVARVEHRDAGHGVETRSHHPEIVTRADYVRVGVIGMDDGISVGAGTM